MASQLFGQAIDYQRVRIHRHPYLPFQPRNCAMSPNGSIYFHPSCFLPDYTRADPQVLHWFMHELVHVWQHQLGYPVRLRGAWRFGLPYAYTLAEDATLSGYNMEAQADLLADYFILKFTRHHEVMRQQRYRGQVALYERVLASFLRARGDAQNLPEGPARRLGAMLRGRWQVA